MGLNWSKQKRRDQANNARQQAIDDSLYCDEITGFRYPASASHIPAFATLTCSCGHRGRISTAPKQRFKCSKCGKKWYT